MSIQYKSEAHRFFGLADNHGVEVNYPYPYQVEKLFVQAGQSIKKGELLAVLIRKDLQLDKAITNNNVQTYKAEETLKRNQLNASLKKLKLEYKIKTDNIQFQINELLRKERVNRKLLATMSNTDGISNTPLELQIKQLRREKKNETSLYFGQKKSLNKQLKDLSSLFHNKVTTLDTKLTNMKGEEKALKVIAPFDGIVSSVQHQPHEEVEAFEPLMTLNSAEPTFVKGYISIENRPQVHLGDKVKILPLSGLARNTNVVGTIKNFSANVLPYPNRLKRYQNVEMWGIEVLIEIPENKFILGEKVLVLNQEKEPLSFQKITNYFFQLTNH